MSEQKLKSKKKLKWWQKLVSDCKAIIAEAKLKEIEYKSNIIRLKWKLGERITQDKTYLEREYGSKWRIDLSNEIKISERDLYYCVQTRKKFTNEQLEEILQRVAKLAWRKFVTEYLPERQKEHVPLPEGVFDVIYADPPWHYEEGTTTTSRQIDTHYPTMQLEEICNIPDLQGKIADNAVLLLWVPKELIRRGLAVMEAWGFEFKTHAVWVKDKIGMGYWFRSQHEDLLLGTKGKFSTPDAENRFSSVIEAPRTKHSKKPEDVYEMIEKMFPNRKYLELFARNKRKDWQGWGLEYA